jgi:hypothetical protein
MSTQLKLPHTKPQRQFIPYFIALLLATILYVAPCTVAFAQTTKPIIDNRLTIYPLQTPVVDTAQLRQYQADPNFQYERKEKVREDSMLQQWLTYIFRKLFEWLRNILPSSQPIAAGQSFWDFITYLLVLIAIALAVSKLLKADLSKVFFRRTPKKAPIDQILLQADINSIDFESDLSRAIRQKDYREAIRLYYLQTLKSLSDKNLIHWQSHKTNKQYRQELKNSALKEPFNRLTHLFDYIWYGEFPIDEPTFEQAQSQFKAFEQYR